MNYASSLATFGDLERFEEARSLLRKTMPVARRVLSESDELSIRMRSLYAQSLYMGDGATLDDLRESVARLEELTRTTRRVLGDSHPLVDDIKRDLQRSRTALRASETQPPKTFAPGWLDGPS